VLLLTDPDHAVPVMVQRSGVRLLASGNGRSDQLQLVNVPLNADIKDGDVVVTSGLGGRFPPGFPVGTVADLHADDSRTFLVGDLRPAAHLDRGRNVLLLKAAAAVPAVPEVGMPEEEAAAAGQEPGKGNAGGKSSGGGVAGATASQPASAASATPPAPRAQPAAPAPGAAPAAGSRSPIPAPGPRSAAPPSPQEPRP
jgi:rod shape-determining protein MreC